MTKNSPYLKQALIRNHAPLRDVKVYLKQGLNIIIGPNGVGKTRFLDLTSYLTNVYGTPKRGLGCELVLAYDQDIRVSFRQLIQSKERTEIFLDDKAIVETVILYGIKESSSTDGLFEALWDVGLKAPLYEVVLAQHGTPLQQLPFVDLPATLTFGKTFAMRIEHENEAVEFMRWPLLIRAILGAIRISFAQNRQYERTNQSADSLSAEYVRNEVERIITAYLSFLSSFLADYSPIEQIRLSKTYQVYDNSIHKEVLVKGLVLEYYLSGSWLPFEALSDGTKRMLYLISQLVMPTATFDKQAAPPAPLSLQIPFRIIFLEEPELGIHPDQLQKLLSLIREVSREHQVIMTTHSPQVLNMLTTKELDRITICELDPKKGTQFRKLSPAKRAKAKAYMQNDSYLSDFWLYSNLEAE